jgi:hypothetical protein
VAELLPTMWGTRGNPVRALLTSLPVAGLSIFAVAVSLCSLVLFVGHNRVALWRLVSLRPAKGQDAFPQLIALLFIVPIGLMMLGGNTTDLYSVRYLLITWQASVMMLAIFFERMLKRVGAVFMVFLLSAWLLQIVFVGYVRLHRWWRYGYYDSGSVRELEGFFEENSVRTGYADYWLSYTLDYMTDERLVVAPYNGVDRYPRYTLVVGAQPIQAYILPGGGVSQEDAQVDDLLQYIDSHQGAGPARSEVVDRLSSQIVLKRRAVANWDVWLVADR